MNPKLFAILVANLFVASPLAFAADGDFVWSGSASLGGLSVHDKARDPSKLNEYRDLDSGGLGMFDVKGRGQSYYLNAFGENLGRNDQSIDLWGGSYGVFKYRLYDNELRHNFGSGPGAMSPYAGIGGSTLTATFPNTNTATWNTFDNSYKRRDLGGMFEFSGNSPWYIRADANEVKRNGVKVIAGAQGTSPGNGFIDLPSPVEFTTRNFSLEGGYSSKLGHFAVSALHSNFSNDDPLLRWSNGFLGAGPSPSGLDTTVLPPDNELTRLAVNGNLRGLPLNSTLAGRVTYSKVTNNVDVRQTMLSTGNTNPATVPDNNVFHGNIKNKTASASLTSNPTRELDTRLYWNWSRKENHSTEVIFSPAQGSGLLAGGGTTTSNCTNGSAVAPIVAARPCEPELFSYKKNNFGIEAGFRVSPGHKLAAGIDYFDTERERIDFTKTKDRKYYAEYKNSMLDTVTGRIKYQYLERRSHFESSDPTNPIDAFVRRFDFANVDQNLVKLVLDISPPVQFLDLGFEAIYKDNDFKDTVLGRTADKRQEYYANVSFGDPKAFRVMAFADMEVLKLDSRHRVGTGTADPNAAPAPAGLVPPGPPFSTTYNWSAKNNDRSWQVGIGADWLPMERLKFAGSILYARTRGTVDFTALPSGGVTPVVSPITLLPIGNFDNTRRHALNLKGTYTYDRHWDFTAGYAYERYRFSDIGFDGFTYTVNNAVPPSATQTAYLSGQSAFQDYTANIFYLLATYKF